MIEPEIRLRRAIHLKDALLVKRIVQTSPQLLKNPDFEDKSNSSLHLAAELGSLEIAQVLLDAGHDDAEISCNTDWETPLMLAADKSNIEVGQLLISRCARCIPWTDRRGMDAVSTLSFAASRPSSSNLIPLLLSHPTYPASVHHRDHQGNTPLHHASAAGSLKALRMLLEAGADPNAKNASKWTPLAYSLTVQAEVYFKQLITEFDPAKRASGQATPGTAPLSLTRTLTNETEAFPPAGFGSPSGATPLPSGRDRGDSRDSSTSQPLPQIQPMLHQQSSRAELLKRKGGGVRLVTAADELPDNRPSTADAGGWSPRSKANVSGPGGRQGYFDPGRTRAGSSDTAASGHPGSFS
ncbi:ankyrin [Myriangium duriaei CBS 260.36]|uniref:Ankyrin n=1 Tax=Myriangium duriaei CBS 260.36 TaxID=1168546 RepID=A0A9P4IZZ5_9PEZI|nr:ankyrin [Myriangium duriaei CBS 260.36]